MIDQYGGPTYIVDISFNKDLSEQKIAEIFDKYFRDDIILLRDRHKLIVIWQVPPYEGEHEIENAMYYILNDGEYGTMNCELIIEGNESDDEMDDDEEESANVINKAIQFATICHENQTRKGTEIPYILHCLEAGTIAANLTTKDGKLDSDVVASAILHDTIEDASVSYEALEEIFNKDIADLVQSQSEDKSKEWQERKETTIKLLRENQSKEVEMATLADKLSNMRSIYRDYKEDEEKLWDKFNAGKESQHWYYKSIAKSLSQVKDSDEYREFTELIKQTFEPELN